jgi:hypothetical protein
MLGQYLVGLGGSSAKRNQHLASVRGVNDQVIEGKTPEYNAISH